MGHKLVLLSWNDDDGGPDFGGGGGNHPDNSLPTKPVYPSHGLPGGGATLPVFPWDPTLPDGGIDNTLPGQGGGGSPLPIRPGAKFVVKWLACHGLILVPDHTLPSTPPPRPDNTLPPTPEPK